MEKLNKELTEVDRKTFNFDLADLHWPDFIALYVKVIFIKSIYFKRKKSI